MPLSLGSPKQPGTPTVSSHSLNFPFHFFLLTLNDKTPHFGIGVCQFARISQHSCFYFTTMTGSTHTSPWGSVSAPPHPDTTRSQPPSGTYRWLGYTALANPLDSPRVNRQHHCPPCGCPHLPSYNAERHRISARLLPQGPALAIPVDYLEHPNRAARMTAPHTDTRCLVEERIGFGLACLLGYRGGRDEARRPAVWSVGPATCTVARVPAMFLLSVSCL